MMTKKQVEIRHDAIVFANDLIGGVYISEPLVLNKCASVIRALSAIILDMEKDS